MDTFILPNNLLPLLATYKFPADFRNNAHSICNVVSMWKKWWQNHIQSHMELCQHMQLHRGYLGKVCNCPDSKVHGANMGPSRANRTQVGPMLAPWTLPSGFIPRFIHATINGCHWSLRCQLIFYEICSVVSDQCYLALQCQISFYEICSNMCFPLKSVWHVFRNMLTLHDVKLSTYICIWLYKSPQTCRMNYYI